MAYTKKKKQNEIDEEEKYKKIICNIPLTTIGNLVMYALDPNISNTNIRNLEKFLHSIDFDKSFKDEEKASIQRLRLLDEILEYATQYKIDDYIGLQEIIENKTSEDYIERWVINDFFEKAIKGQFLSNNQISYISDFIQKQLDMHQIRKKLGYLKKLIQFIEHPEIGKQDAVLNKSKEILLDLYREFNLNEMNKDEESYSFDITNEDSAMKLIKESLEARFNPGNKLSTGYQMLDKMLGGGLQEGRCYLLLGIAKAFKSGTLLNIALNVATNFYDVRPKNPDKIPTVLYFTMENSLIETLDRIYKYFGMQFNFKYKIIKNKFGKEHKEYTITDKDVKDILDFLQKETYEKTGIMFRIEYQPHKKVDTSYLDKLYDEYYNNQDMEIIFVVQDYIKRIRSQRFYDTSQKRDELGEVVNEFCNFAKARKIPVLTASQLNRDALKKVEISKESKKKDLSRKLGGSQVGESSLLYENADYTIIIDREEDEDHGMIYQTFHKIMARGDSFLDYFAQPYEKDPKYSNFKIAVDTDLEEPLGVERISDVLDADEVRVLENTNNSVKLLNKTKLPSRFQTINEENEDGEEIVSPKSQASDF